MGRGEGHDFRLALPAVSRSAGYCFRGIICTCIERQRERWMLDWHVGGVYRALNVAVRMRFFMVENCGWVGIINVGGFFNLEPFFEML